MGVTKNKGGRGYSNFCPALQKSWGHPCVVYTNFYILSTYKPYCQIHPKQKQIEWGRSGYTGLSQICLYVCVSSVCLSVYDSTSSSLGFNIHSAVKSLLPVRLGDDETQRPQSLSTLSATKGMLQHNLSSEIGLLSAAHCLSSAPHRRDAARLLSAQDRGSRAWLEALPSSDRYALIAKDFRIASFLRLSLPMPFKSCINKCECGVELDETGYHLLTCKFGGGPVWQHNSIVSGWCSCLNKLQLHHRKEPREHYTESENRPDSLMYDESSTELDVSMAHLGAETF